MRWIKSDHGHFVNLDHVTHIQPLEGGKDRFYIYETSFLITVPARVRLEHFLKLAILQR